MSSKIQVRTIRPHDTAEDMKLPGEFYDRMKEDADHLSAPGVVGIITPAKARASR